MFALQAACPERLDSKRLLFLDVDGVLHPLKVGSKWLEMARNGSKWVEWTWNQCVSFPTSKVPLG